jgi:hypothetical protein
VAEENKYKKGASVPPKTNRKKNLNVVDHLLSKFMIQVANLNGFCLKRLGILNTCSNLTGHLIIF